MKISITQIILNVLIFVLYVSNANALTIAYLEYIVNAVIPAMSEIYSQRKKLTKVIKEYFVRPLRSLIIKSYKIIDNIYKNM